MSQNTRPLMRVNNTPNGATLITSRLNHGSLDAEILSRDRERLHIIYVQTDADHLRRGIASSLITSTIRGAILAGGETFQSVEFPVINPVVVPLLGRIFDGSIVWYAEQEDKDTCSNPLDPATAQTLLESREAQSEAFKLNGLDFPDDFDPGIYAVVSLDPAQISQWVMPHVIFVDNLF
jgi:hypothetical protein